MESGIMQLVAAFIGIAILLGVGTQILGNSVQDCTNLNDYDATLTTQAEGTWAAQCEENNGATQSAYSLLLIVLIVVAAVVILTVIKLL